ncbi:MAG: formyltetrahydrofolate deformylase [Planctomycetes bacterium]|nr:formyltetrahydrofolate deformylase [Planctomycetota bacterium]
MQVIITAVGPDNRGLADPIVHHVATAGANIAEIQMYDRDTERLFAMLLRMDWPAERISIDQLRYSMNTIGKDKGLSIRTWSADENTRLPRVAICTTHRPEPATAVLQAMRDGILRGTPAVVLGNRPACQSVAQKFGVDWHMIGDDKGNPDNEKMVSFFDSYQVDYVVLARYMRIIPASTCWKYAGGRIINLHHGLLPPYPGPQPYQDAFKHRMLTYGATVHFIVPELDAGEQIIHQDAFAVPPGTSLEKIMQIGQSEHEPACLVAGLRRVFDREVELHFHKIVALPKK